MSAALKGQARGWIRRVWSPRRWVVIPLVGGLGLLALLAGQAVMSPPAAASPGSAFISFGGLMDLGPTDDGSSPQTPLGFTMDYFGTPYTSVYVNANGDLTFAGPLSSYTPSGIGNVGMDIVAPYFADVNTLYGNTVQYGESTLDGHPVFVAEWPYVDCYQDSSSSSSVTDAFEVILIDRPDLGTGDFQIEYNYDQIQWDAGQASDGTTSAPICQSTLDADAAVVGFSNATGTKSYELPGSQTNGAFIDSNSSTGLIYNDLNSDTPVSVPASDSPVQGRYIWEVENGSLGTPTALSGSLTSTSESGTFITVSPGTAVSATASLLGDNVGSAGGTVTYNIYSGSGCTGSVYMSASSGNVTDGSVGAFFLGVNHHSGHILVVRLLLWRPVEQPGVRHLHRYRDGRRDHHHYSREHHGHLLPVVPERHAQCNGHLGGERERGDCHLHARTGHDDDRSFHHLGNGECR